MNIDTSKLDKKTKIIIYVTIALTILFIIWFISSSVRSEQPEQEENTPTIPWELPDKEVVSKLSWSNLAFLNGQNPKDVKEINFAAVYTQTNADVWTFDGVTFSMRDGSITVVVPHGLKITGNMRRAFAGLENLEKITGLSLVDTSEVQDMSGLVAGCASLKEMDMSELETDSLKNAEEMFAGCGLETIDLSKNNLSNLENGKRMFAECSQLTKLTMTKTPSMKSAESFLEDGGNVEDGLFIDGDWDTSNCQNIATALKSSGITRWEFLKKLDTSKMQDASYMLAGNTMSSLDLSGWDMNNVVNAKGMMQDCKQLETFTPAGWSIPMMQSCQEIFSGCVLLSEIKIDWRNADSLLYASKMFYNCVSLQKADLTGFDYCHLGDATKMFYGCESLKEVIQKNFKADITEDMFEGCALDSL